MSRFKRALALVLVVVMAGCQVGSPAFLGSSGETTVSDGSGGLTPVCGAMPAFSFSYGDIFILMGVGVLLSPFFLLEAIKDGLVSLRDAYWDR